MVRVRHAQLMAQEANEKPLDVRALAEELCREMRTQRLFVLPEGESLESTVETVPIFWISPTAFDACNMKAWLCDRCFHFASMDRRRG